MRDDDESSKKRPRTTRTTRLEIQGGLVPPSAGGELASYLLVISGDGVGRRFEVTPSGADIGRSAEAGIAVRESAVSSRHCRVALVEGRVEVEDLDSTNGTWVDGRQISGTVVLEAGSVLQVGRTVMRLELRSQADVLQAMRLNADLEKAAAYVRALLPNPREEGTPRIEWVFEPCEALGGDAFGYFDLEDGRTVLYLIDVCGHGVGSALHSVAVVNALRQRTLPGVDFGDPAAVLAALNRTFEMEAHGDQYFTIWYGVIDRERRGIIHAAGGHPAAVLVRGGEARDLGVRSPAIGLFPTSRFRAEETPLEPGDRLFVFSDGVFEVVTRDGVDWSRDDLRLIMQARPEDGIPEPHRIRDAVDEISGADHRDDDFSLLVATF